MKSSKGKRIGCLFGSFNPIHIGHLMIAEYMSSQTDLDEVHLIVSPLNPLKASTSLADEAERLHMCRLATQDNSSLIVSDVEFGLPRPSYTIDTLEHLLHANPVNEYVLIMGSDNLEIFEQWKRWKDIIAHFEIYVYDRPAHFVPDTRTDRIRRFHAPMVDLSSTYIRDCLRNGHSVRYLVPDPVREYIEAEGLFQELN